MVLTAEIIKRYENILFENKSCKLALSKSKSNSSHCLILQSKDELLLDILSFFYIKSLFDAKQDDFFKKLLANNIPDVIYLPRGEKLSVSDAEFIDQTAYLTPLQYDTKIYVIEKSETMNAQTQNKLLKLFEEPPPSSRFLLKCSSLSELLPTVKSRSEIIEIQPLSVDEITKTLVKDTGLSVINLVKATSFGRLDYTEQVVSDGSYTELETLAFETLKYMKRSSDMLKYASRILKYKDYFDTFIFYIECILHDCMLNSVNERQRIYFSHRQSEIEILTREFNADTVLKLTKVIERARQRSSGFGNITGIVDELLFSILEVKTKWQRL